MAVPHTNCALSANILFKEKDIQFYILLIFEFFKKENFV